MIRSVLVAAETFGYIVAASNISSNGSFVVFGTAGTEDFNWLEMRSLDQRLTPLRHVAFFDGGQVWLSSDLAMESVAWLDLQAMKPGRMPRDRERIKSICDTRQAKAKAASEEWRRFQLLEGLHKDCGLPAPVRSKAVKDAQRKDQAEALAGLRTQWQKLIASANGDTDSPARRRARRVSRGLLIGARGRTTDPDYLKLLATYRLARGGAR